MSKATRKDTRSPAADVADRHDLIRVVGARVNNLKDVSVEGTPADLVADRSTLTGEHLAA